MRNVLLIILIFVSPYALFADVINNQDKCIDKICSDESCYEKNLTIYKDQTTTSSANSWSISSANAEYYKDLNKANDFLDVTERVLNDEDVSSSIKQFIIDYKRKIFVFLYPSDGLLVPAFLSYTPGAKDNSLIMFLRGGSKDFSVPHPAQFANFQQNNIIGTIYRGSVGEGKDDRGGDDVNDIYNLVKYINVIEHKTGHKITSKKKYMIGYSRGAMQMFLALIRFPELQEFFNKAISVSGDIDPYITGKDLPRRVESFYKSFGLTKENEENWYKHRTAKYHIGKISKDLPILILQTTKDQKVSLKQGVELYNLMKESGHNVTYWEIKGGSHCMMNCTDRLEIFDKWLNQ